MSDLMLTRQSPLSELELDFGEVAVAELVSRAIVSIATPYGGGEKLSEGGSVFPKNRNSLLSENQQRQMLIVPFYLECSRIRCFCCLITPETTLWITFRKRLRTRAI